MAFLNIPESDYRLDEPDVKSVVVKLKFDEPLIKEHPSKFSGGTYKKYYYTVEESGTEYTIGATEALHKAIQAVMAIRDSEIKILKKRIGDDAKDIRWSVSHIGGPQGQATQKTAASSSGSSTSSSQPPARPDSRIPYEPLTDEALAVWGINQADEAALYDMSLTQARKLWDEDTDPKVIQATAASLFIQGTRTTGGTKNLNNLALPPEPDPITLIIKSIDQDEMPDSFYEAIIATSSVFKDDPAEVTAVMKALGMTGIPNTEFRQYEDIKKLMIYVEYVEDGMEPDEAIEEIINEPPF